MTATSHNPLRLDIKPLINDAQTVRGRTPLAQFVRLKESVVADQMDADAAVAWQFQGELRPVTGGAPEMWGRLSADVEVALVCQRCLAAVREHLSLDRWVRFVQTEEEAEALDGELEDDVLALPRTLNLLELVEDELILGLPLVPRHGVCPEPLPVPADDLPVVVEENPFAALAGLKGKLGK
ncbi:MAG: hypothetical protein C4K60_09875 [Ideonella sp. MAG2]|nr:MAG: hypothetical protein C4K60_09875 [Ideonella sp. MAG2]